MRIELVVDRLRDLVRRSILARLVLNDEGRWRLREDPPPIDQLLTDALAAADWRDAWHLGMAELGASEAVHPAVPLLDSIFDTYPEGWVTKPVERADVVTTAADRTRWSGRDDCLSLDIRHYPGEGGTVPRR